MIYLTDPLRDGSPNKALESGHWFRVTRTCLLALNQLLEMQTGTRLNALLLMRGTVIAQQCGAIRFTAAYLRNTTSDSLPSELFEFDSDVFVSTFLLLLNAIVLDS